jgi:protein-S-isoprenylcysteine O-methyltransferase Ste14
MTPTSPERVDPSARRATRSPWWRGPRGEWFVVAQALLFALVIFGPRRPAGPAAGAIGSHAAAVSPAWRGWPPPWAHIASAGGGLLFVLGALLLLAGVMKLGTKLTAFPRPGEHAILHTSGAFRLVRHPMYSGGIFMAFGWGLWINGWLTLIYATALLIFFDIKSRREERWLCEKFADYAAYQRRVKRLVPFVY